MSKATEFWLWWITDEVTGKRRKTRHRMTKEEALQRHPGAEPVVGSCEVRDLPETPAEFDATHHHSINRKA